MSQYKPDGYSTVSPYLLVNGADATIAFLKRVFDAIELRRYSAGTAASGTRNSGSTTWF